MKNFLIPKPKSGGSILSYKCNGKFKHCMYFIHVCFDMRKDVVLKTNKINELTPAELYHHIKKKKENLE